MLRPETPEMGSPRAETPGIAEEAAAGAGVFDRLSRVAAEALRVSGARIVVVRDGVRRVVGRAGEESAWSAATQLDVQVAETRGAVAVGEVAAAEGSVAAAYAGVPLGADDAGVAGVVAVVDDRPREWSAGELRILSDLAAVAARELALDAERVRAEVLGVAQEAQLRRLAEADQFLSLAESSLAGIYLLQDDRILYCNPRFAEIFGYTREELMSRVRLMDLVAEPDRERVSERARRRFSDDASDPPTFGFIGQRADGGTVEVEIYGTVTRVDGRPAVLGTLLDMTERNQALRALRESELRNRFLARASALLDRSLDPAVTLDRLARLCVPALADACIIDLAEDDGTLRRIAGAHRDRARGAALRSAAACPPEAPPDRYLPVRVARTREPVLLVDGYDEAQGRLAFDPGGHEALVALGIRSLLVLPLAARRRVVGVITLVTTGDSERRFARTDQGVAKDLARRAAMATDNARLYAAAQAAVQARDEVLRVVSHDLRNPLNTIQLAASLLLDTGEERRRDNVRQLDMIRRTALQMNDMIQDLLDVSTLESGHFAVERTDHDVASVLDHACELLEPLARHAGVELVREVEGELPEVAIDGPRIQRVFSNLVGNAIKFTPRGGRIVVRARPVAEGVEFSIRDTGPGIPESQRETVFDRFWQGRRGDRRGSGLGLAICKGIVEAHGGRIWVEGSPAGQGATITFTIPRQEPQQAA